MKGFSLIRYLILSVGVVTMLYFAGLWLEVFQVGYRSAQVMASDIMAFAAAAILVVWMLVAHNRH